MSYVPGTIKWGDGGIGTSSGGPVTWSADYFDALNIVPGTSEADFDDALLLAFDRWESVASVDFEMAMTGAEANIFVGSKDLGFDVAGQAELNFFPATMTFESVDVFFATDLTWDPMNNFFQVALHEIGHAIGLEHVEDVSEIMNPIISADDLGNGDIAAAQYLYGRDGSDAPMADAEQVLPPSSGLSSSGGGGGGAIAAILGLLALVFGLLPGGAVALAAGRLAKDDEDEPDDTLIETVALADYDIADFLPTIAVSQEHEAYVDQSDEDADDEMPFLM